jgi:hypothetical protein
MLDIGQERSKVKTALAAEPGCIGDSKSASLIWGGDGYSLSFSLT